MRDGRTRPVDAGYGRSSSSILPVAPAVVFECMFI